jgi:hypothetical protein
MNPPIIAELLIAFEFVNIILLLIKFIAPPNSIAVLESKTDN